MKKLVALMLAATLTFGLFACSGGKESGSTDTTQSETKTDDEAGTDTDKAAEGDGGADTGSEAGGGENLEKSLAIDVSGLKSTDNQKLIPDMVIKDFPERPADPSSLPDDDAGKYYDMEYAGWDAGEKVDSIPASPADGCVGKHIIVIVHGDHPWTTAYTNGVNMTCEALGMTVDVWSPNWDVNVQNQLIDQAINAKPDAIALIPLNAESAVQQFRKITEAGIPAFGTNTLTTSDALSYMIAWSGPDDWAQSRALARTMADAIGKEGGVCYMTHNAGTSPYFARMYGPITELKEYAPNIKTLDFQTPGFDAPKCKQVVTDWITRFGDELKAIYLADDSAQAIGTVDALKEAGREDVVVVALGNSKQGMDLVKSGDLTMISTQTAEGDGAAAVKNVADWFNGQEVPPISYFGTDMITQDNVDSFYPSQW